MGERRTPEQERVHRRQRLAAALRIFAERGFEEGAGGHITARDSIMTDHFWVNPFGVYFGHVRACDLLLVDHNGTVVQGEGTVNPAGYAIHSQIHAAHPRVIAAAHTHSPYGRAWSALSRPLAAITQDACAFFERHTVFQTYTGVVLDIDEGKRIAQVLGDAGTAVILQNHGLLTVGGSVEEAAWWFVAMDRSCQVQLLAEAAGDPIVIDDDAARAARDVIGTPGIARLNFRLLFADIVRRQPELLD
ncbi:class II aldolase/adducin family protein [Plantactinospora sp. WMMC1484]|uniref:class II aldolase/adducin family protein n=1 Tax=Plantactinospora sp. WMMC1484 TaxID=3404122 RepID=UPI003BF607F7